MNEEPKKKFYTRWWFWVLAIVIVITIIIEFNNKPVATPINNTTASNPNAWYYITQNYQCVKAPGEYQTEGECQRAVGAYCHGGDSTCNDVKKITLYYINSSNNCVLAPHNPYSPVGTTIDGNFAEQDACTKDVGQNCYTDSTCGGAGATGIVTIKGVAYKLTTSKELIQNYSNPGFAGNGGNSASMVAVKGTITAVFPENKPNNNYSPGGTYDVVISTGDGFVVSMQGTIDPNTKASNGFIPADFPVGAKIVAGGVFMGDSNDITLKTLTDSDPQNPSVTVPDPKLATLGLPANTPLLISLGTDNVQAQ